MTDMLLNKIEKHEPLLNRIETGDYDDLVKISDMALLVDPEYSLGNNSQRIGRQRMFNLVNGGSLESGNNTLPIVSGLIDSPAGALGPDIISNVDINPEAWSLFAAVKPLNDAAVKHIFASIPAVSETGLRIGFATSGTKLNVYRLSSQAASQPTKIEYVGNFPSRPTPAFVMITFSVENGLKIYDNGVLVAQNTDDELMVTGYKASQYRLYSTNFRGLGGACGLVNDDLSKPERAQDRQLIEQFMIARYGITN